MTAETKETKSPMSRAEIKRPIKFPIKDVVPVKGNKIKNPTEIEFPTLEDLEMDVPLLNEHMEQHRIAPEDESMFEVECLKHCNPSLAITSLGL